MAQSTSQKFGHPVMRPIASPESNANLLKEPLLLQHDDSTTDPQSTAHKRLTQRKTDKHNTSFSKSERKAIEVAAVYISDAIHVRKPQTRIQEKGINLNICNHHIYISPLNTYKFVHNRYWKIILYLVIWTHLLLIIYAPKNFNDSHPDNYDDRSTNVQYLYPMHCIHLTHTHNNSVGAGHSIPVFNHIYYRLCTQSIQSRS